MPFKSMTKRLKPIAAAVAIAGGGLLCADLLYADTANYATITSYTSAVVQATNNFFGTLSASQLGTQQTACTMSGGGTLSYGYLVGLVECWINLPGNRNGLQMANLTSSQQSSALALLSTALSARGATTVAEIRASDDVIAATQANTPWGGAKYSVALYGVPSTSTPWQLQFSGHHLAINLNYNTAYPSATPMFLGNEPPNWTDSSGTYHAPLDVQRSAVYNLAEALQTDSTTKTAAVLSGTYTDVTMGANTATGCDSNFPVTYPSGSTGRGVAVSSLSTAQKNLVKSVISAWTAMAPRTVANTLNNAYTSDSALSQTYVGLGLGSSGRADFPAKPSGLSSQQSYLRIDGPRVWIEFVVQQGVAYSTQVHYHSLWRDKIADYGGNFSTASAGTTGLCGAATTNAGGGTGPTGGPPNGTPPTGTPPTAPAGV